MRSKGASRKSQASSEGASEEDFSFAWNHLLDEIADDAQRTESYTGQTSFKVSVMQALADVPREAFVPDGSRRKAYDNRPLPIGQRQTISQPYIVTLVTDLLDLKPNGRVLEIGTGCGYQTAVLAALTNEIFSVEYLEDLHRSAKVGLTNLGCRNIRFRQGDGWQGWPKHAPYDAIIVTAAAAARIQDRLKEQFAPGERLLVPVGRKHETQFFTRIVRSPDGTFDEERGLPVAFVPLVEDHQDNPGFSC
ncbi:MAG: protein-L-isoaspartate(D-aspartate) O-methyltransferase [Pseudomonadota bacterium]|nr:protein-L-isoaspartate(D-aspartate) O-methyltransferase [Pseudomonadota bacterium]